MTIGTSGLEATRRKVVVCDNGTGVGEAELCQSIDLASAVWSLTGMPVFPAVCQGRLCR